MDDHHTLSAAEYEARREGHLQGRRLEMVAAAIRRHVGAAGRVLEIGCGPGALVASLAEDHSGIEFLGVDIEAKMIDHARARHRRPNLTFAVRNLVEEPFARPVDLAYSIDVLHHVEPLAPFVRAAREALSPGGCWLAIEPNIYNPYIFWSQGHMRRSGLDEDHFRPWVAEPLFAGAGFELASRRYGFLVPGFVGRLPGWVTRAERRMENLRWLGGSVIYELLASSRRP